MNVAWKVLRISSKRVLATMVVASSLFLLVIFLTPLRPGSRSTVAAVAAAVAILAVEVVYIGWLLCIGLVSNFISKSPLGTRARIATAMFPLAVIYAAWFSFVMFSRELPAVLLPFHLFAMFVNVYIIWFSSRSLHASELDRRPVVREYLATFLLLWFAPLFPPAAKWTHERVQANVRCAAGRRH